MLSLRVWAQTPVSYERIVAAAKEPHNWLTYGGDYLSQHYSRLTQITPANVKSLNLAWTYQWPTVTGGWQATPLVVDGIMYLTQRPNDVVALDAATGRVFWIYRYNNSAELGVCCGGPNRGLAILGETLFMATLDAHLVAIDARDGTELWRSKFGESKLGYSGTVAPLAIKDLVIVGAGGGEYGIRGLLVAYDAKTGKERWRFNTVPGPGEPGHETWEQCPPNPTTYCDPQAWTHGGGSIWVTGSYDPELNLTYWGVGNPSPDYSGDQRPGDNLYTNTVVALDVDTGQLKWHYQFTPHDVYDFDAVQIPVLADITFRGAPMKALLWANRNGIYYVLDRTNGKFLSGTPMGKVNWMSGFDANGRPSADAAAAWCADLSGASGHYELVFAIVQSAHRSDVRLHLGRECRDLRGSPGRVQSNRAVVWWGAAATVRAVARGHRQGDSRRPQRAVAAAGSDQHLDRCCRQRRRNRDRSGHRETALALRDVRCDRRRNHDNSDRSPHHRWARGLPSASGCANRRVAVAKKPRRADAEQSDHLCRERKAVRDGHRRADDVHVLAAGLDGRATDLLTLKGTQ